MSENFNETVSAEAVDETTPATETPESETREAAPEATEAAEESREAAKYRRKLREAEAELGGLRTQVQALQRAEVDRHVAAAGIKPAAVWAAGTELGSLLAQDGTVSAERVAQAVTATRETLGIRPLPPAPSAHGQGNVGEPIGMGSEPSWQGAFAPRS